MAIISSKKVGIADAQQQPIAFGRRTDGRYTVVPYESTDPNQINAIAIACESIGLQYEVTQTFGKMRIDVHYAYNWAGGTGDPATEVVERWECIPLQTEKSLFDPTNYLAYSAITTGAPGAGSRQLNAAQAFAEKGELDTWFHYDPDVGDSYFAPPRHVLDPNVIFLLKYYFDGVRTFPIAVPSLKHTRIVNESWISPMTVPGRPTLYSTPALIADFSIPAGILILLPFSDTGLIFHDTTVLPFGRTGLPDGYRQTMGYGWLRSAPEVTPIANFKWMLSETFQYGLWGLNLFGGRLHDITAASIA